MILSHHPVCFNNGYKISHKRTLDGCPLATKSSKVVNVWTATEEHYGQRGFYVVGR